MSFKPPANIEVKESLIHGYGVFTTKDFRQGEVVEECPSVDLPTNYQELPKCIQRYSFSDKGLPSLVLGYGMVYNHSKSPNAYYVIAGPTDDVRFIFSTFEPIKSGEELLIDYGSNYDYDLFESEVLESPVKHYA